MVLEAAKFSKPVKNLAVFCSRVQGSRPSPRVSLQPGLEGAAPEELGGSTYTGTTITLEPQQRLGRD